jgi:type IV pilus biogenesis protein CpaD/CtpE
MRREILLCSLACLLGACASAPKYNYAATPLNAGTTAPVTDSQNQPQCRGSTDKGGVVCAAYMGVVALEQSLFE